MKKASLLMIIVCMFYMQSNAQEVVSSSGDYFANNNFSISWTIGEPITETLDNGTVILTQGFQQSNLTAVSVFELSDEDITVNIAPNPTDNYINLSVSDFKDVRYELSDFNGKLIRQGNVNSDNTKINFSELSSSVYFLRVIQNSQVINTFKVIKQ